MMFNLLIGIVVGLLLGRILEVFVAPRLVAASRRVAPVSHDDTPVELSRDPAEWPVAPTTFDGMRRRRVLPDPDVVDLQRFHGLTPDGIIIGPRTRAAIARHLAQHGDRVARGEIPPGDGDVLVLRDWSGNVVRVIRDAPDRSWVTTEPVGSLRLPTRPSPMRIPR